MHIRCYKSKKSIFTVLNYWYFQIYLLLQHSSPYPEERSTITLFWSPSFCTLKKPKRKHPFEPRYLLSAKRSIFIWTIAIVGVLTNSRMLQKKFPKKVYLHLSTDLKNKNKNTPEMVTVREYVYILLPNLDRDHFLKLHQKTGRERSLESSRHSRGSISWIPNMSYLRWAGVLETPVTGGSGPLRRSSNSLTVTRGWEPQGRRAGGETVSPAHFLWPPIAFLPAPSPIYSVIIQHPSFFLLKVLSKNNLVIYIKAKSSFGRPSVLNKQAWKWSFQVRGWLGVPLTFLPARQWTMHCFHGFCQS